MSISVPEKKHNIFGRINMWYKEDDTDINDYSGGLYPKKLQI